MQAVPNQPVARILGVLGEPGRGAAQPEAVAPLVHVAAHALPADVRQRLRQHDLQVAHGALLRIVAARIRIQSGAPLRRHADEMRALVQHRVQRRIEPREDLRADQARLALAPIGARE